MNEKEVRNIFNLFNKAKKENHIPLYAQEAKSIAEEYILDEKKWDSITIKRIKEIENSIKKLSEMGFFEYSDYLGNYYGENMDAIKQYFIDLGYKVRECRKNQNTANPYVVIEIKWSK